MDFTKEMIGKAKKAASAEELAEMAKAEGMELSEADAETYFSFLSGRKELSDEELAQVAGGKGDPDPRYKMDQRVEIYFKNTQSYLYGMIIRISSIYASGWGYCYGLVLDDHTYRDFYLERPDPNIIVRGL